MDVWQIGLYGFGAFLAFRALAGLMEIHRQQTLHELAVKHVEEENRRRRAELDAKKTAAESETKNTAA